MSSPMVIQLPSLSQVLGPLAAILVPFVVKGLTAIMLIIVSIITVRKGLRVLGVYIDYSKDDNKWHVTTQWEIEEKAETAEVIERLTALRAEFDDANDTDMEGMDLDDLLGEEGELVQRIETIENRLSEVLQSEYGAVPWDQVDDAKTRATIDGYREDMTYGELEQWLKLFDDEGPNDFEVGQRDQNESAGSSDRAEMAEAVEAILSAADFSIDTPDLTAMSDEQIQEWIDANSHYLEETQEKEEEAS